MTITIRPAPSLSSYPRIWSHPVEDATERIEYCVCGVYVVQYRRESIPAVVRRHNASLSHQLWRESSPGPTATPGAVDVSNVPAVRPAGGRR